MLWAAKQKKTAPLIHNNLLLKPFGALCLAAAKQRRLNNKNAEPLASVLSSDGQPSEQAQLQAKCCGMIQTRHSSSLRLLCQLHCQCLHQSLLGFLLYPQGAAADLVRGAREPPQEPALS